MCMYVPAFNRVRVSIFALTRPAKYHETQKQLKHMTEERDSLQTRIAQTDKAKQDTEIERTKLSEALTQAKQRIAELTAHVEKLNAEMNDVKVHFVIFLLCLCGCLCVSVYVCMYL